MPDAVEIARPSHSAAIREATALFHDRRYLTLLGKATGTGVAAGILARKLPAFGLPIALLAGIYVGLELAAYMADETDRRGAIDAPSIRIVPDQAPALRKDHDADPA